MSKTPQLFKPIAEPAEPKLEHHCCVCGVLPAMFGYGVSLRHGKPGIWYCWEHWPDAPEKRRKVAA